MLIILPLHRRFSGTRGLMLYTELEQFSHHSMTDNEKLAYQIQTIET